jgi:cysteine synthase A
MTLTTDSCKLSGSTQVAALWKHIGNTELIAVSYSYKGGTEQEVLVKCEQFNLTGSIKDRMALHILQKACEQGKIKPGDMIVEATSGNTGIAFAAIGKAIGNRVRIIMPDWMSLERRALIKSYGAEIQLVSKEEGGFLGCIEIAEKMGQYEGVFLPRQFANLYNVEAHEKTGREIGYSLLLERIVPAAFIAGVGTGGTIMGVGKYLRTLFPDIKIHPLEPAESPTLTTGYKVGSHRIQGISDEFIPEIVDLKALDKVVQVSDGDGILMAQKITSELGMPVGISSGANLVGAMILQQQLGGNAPVVTIFPDDNKKYLSTDLFKNEPVKEHYLSKDVRLIAHRVLSKV